MSRHVVWDWNGTLLDDREACVTATIEALGLQDGAARAATEPFERPLRRYYSRLVGKELSAKEFVSVRQRWDLCYLSLWPHIYLRTDALTAIKEADAKGFTQSVLSMTPHEHLQLDVDRRGISGLFLLVEGSRGDPPGKSQLLRKHLKKLGVPPSETTLVGDSEDDAVAAGTVGTRFVRIESGYEPALSGQATGAQVVSNLLDAVRSLDLPESFEQIDRGVPHRVSGGGPPYEVRERRQEAT